MQLRRNKRLVNNGFEIKRKTMREKKRTKTADEIKPRKRQKRKKKRDILVGKV